MKTTRHRMSRHRQSLLAALGLLAPACAQDAATQDPAEDAAGASAGGETSAAGGAGASGGGFTTDARHPLRDLGAGGLTTDARPPRPDHGSTDAGRADGRVPDQGVGGSASDASTPPPPDAAGGSGGVPVEPPRCVDPQPILQRLAGPAAAAEPTGFVECADGAVNRSERVECRDPLPPGRACNSEGGSCRVDADCVDLPHGRCTASEFEDPSCHCRYGCETDTDCDFGPGLVCVCGGHGDAWFPEGAMCVSADCVTDADCGGFGCGFSAQNNGCGYDYGLRCRTEADTCADNADCGDPDGYTACVRWDEAPWSCQPGAVCGRPLRVEGLAVTAPFVRRSDWLDRSTRATVSPLGAADRSQLAEHYRSLAALEHASVASFARFALDLMAFGAPPDLLADTARAMVDEVDHARRCYALAAVYGGAPVGPGRLDVSGAESPADLAALAISVIREACVGELLGATEAEHVSEHAADPVIRDTFAVIAADERRHAELGWRTLKWILAQPDAPSPDVVATAFDDAIADFAHADGAADDRLLDHGLPSATLRRQLFAEAADELIRPCLAALLNPTWSTADAA